jgi:hypothetical protein
LSTFLGQGCDALPVDICSYMIDGKMADLTVTKESCIPVTAFQKSNDLFIDIDYIGISIGKADMAIFNIPIPCL